MRYAWPFRHPGMGSIYLNVNRNKRSVVLDLKKDAAREACLALARRSDVLVYNIRPQAMARLKLSYDEVRKVNPRIIYAGCFGYSQRGPYAAKAAYDDLIQGAAGLPWLLQKQGALRAALRADDRRRSLRRPAGRQRGQRGSLPSRENRQRPAHRRADVRALAADRARRSSRRLHLRPAARRAGLRAHPHAGPPSPTRPPTAMSARSSIRTSSGRRFSTSSASRSCSPGPSTRRRRRAARTTASPTPWSPTR